MQSPRQRIEAECARVGRPAVVAGCVRLLLGAADTDERLVAVLGGPGAAWALDDEARTDRRYWLRVWAARGLLWAWEDSALAAVIAGCGDEAWRVREMAAKVAARNLVGDALPAVAALVDDPVPRVRAAAFRAVGRITSAGA